MAAQVAICNDVLTQLDGVVSCSTPWVFSSVPPSDLAWLQSAFTFDLALFSELTGYCVLFFIHFI